MADDDIDGLLDKIRNETDPIVKARMLVVVTREKNMPVYVVGKELNLSPAYLCNLMRVARLPEIVIDGFYSKNVSLTHLLVISRLKNDDDIVDVYEKTLQNNLPVAGVESLVRAKLYDVTSDGKRIEPDIVMSIQDVFKKIDPTLTVEIVQTRIKARVSITVKGNMAKTTQALQKLADSKLIKRTE